MDKRRIHVAGVGHREVERVVFPLKQLKADLVYLLAHETERAGDSRAAGFRKSIRAQLERAKIEVEEVETNLWDTPTVANLVRRLIDKQPDGEFRFNVSTGPKTCALGGYLASMFWPIRIYYVHVDYKKERSHDHESQYPPTEIEFLPTFRSEVPRPQVVAALAAILEKGGKVLQADLLRELSDRKIIRSTIPDQDLSPQAAHSQLQSILSRLELLAFIERGTGSSRTEIHVTPEGEAGLRLFQDAPPSPRVKRKP